MSPFTRLNPSPRYRALVSLYRTMHEEGEQFAGKAPEETFPGMSLAKELVRIKQLVQRTQARTILDYGAGKGILYERSDLAFSKTERIGSVQSYWGVERIDRYDPAYAPFNALPEGTFHGVVCTDVLEHCPEEDVDWILAELFGFAERFVYMAIASYPAEKRLPSGENAHVTIKPPRWWIDRISAAAARAPQVLWGAVVDEARTDERGEPALTTNFIGAIRP